MVPKIITGLPAGIKEAGQRVDFRPEQFDLVHKTKGYRVWWSRASLCPCENNTKTGQPQPNCSLCGGKGRFYFLPDPALTHGGEDAYGNPVTLNTAGDAVQIFAIMTSATLDTQVFERFGEFFFGTVKVTTQGPNKLGYLDRIALVDSEMTWSQIIVADGTSTIPTNGAFNEAGIRYPAVSVNLLRSLTTIYVEDTNFKINSTGQIEWITTPPVEGTRLAIHFILHPVFEIMDHVFSHRDTLIRKKKKTTDVAGQFFQLPVHAMAKLDYLVHGNIVSQ